MRSMIPFTLLLLATGPWEKNDDRFLSSALIGTMPSGTGITVVAGAQRGAVVKTTLSEAALTASATTQDFTWTFNPRTRVGRIVTETTVAFSGGTVAALTLSCGSSAGGAQYLIATTVMAANAVVGDAAAEVGLGLLSATLADFQAFTGNTTVSCRFTATGDNVVNLTAGSISIWMEVVPYP